MTARRLIPTLRSQTGFTLVELVIVMTIIGLVAAISLPRIDIARYQAETAMQSMGTTLLAAQRLAVTRQHDVILTFDVANAVVRVHEDADNDGQVGGGERVRSAPLGDKIVFGRSTAPARPMGAAAVNFTKTVGGLPALIFRRSGSASEEGGFYLTSRRAAASGSRPTDARAIEIERATGRATWYRYTSPNWTRGF